MARFNLFAVQIANDKIKYTHWMVCNSQICLCACVPYTNTCARTAHPHMAGNLYHLSFWIISHVTAVRLSHSNHLTIHRHTHRHNAFRAKGERRQIESERDGGERKNRRKLKRFAAIIVLCGAVEVSLWSKWYM